MKSRAKSPALPVSMTYGDDESDDPKVISSYFASFFQTCYAPFYGVCPQVKTLNIGDLDSFVISQDEIYRRILLLETDK